MKQFFNKLVFVFIISASLLSGCDSLKGIISQLTGNDIAGGLKEALIQGITKGGQTASNGGLFNSSNMLSSFLPPEAVKVINTLQSLGLASDVTNFTDNLTKAASNSAVKAVPILVGGVQQMNFTDALGILKGGSNAATNFLRSSVGDSLKKAIIPEVGLVLNQYHLNEALKNLVSKSPIPGLGKNLNLDLNDIVAKMVANKMFDQVEQEEYKIRTDINFRTTDLMKRVFGNPQAYHQ